MVLSVCVSRSVCLFMSSQLSFKNPKEVEGGLVIKIKLQFYLAEHEKNVIQFGCITVACGR